MALSHILSGGASVLRITRASSRLAPNLGSFAVRNFSGYEGQTVTDQQLIKKSDDWVIEETNFCLGRVANVRFKETDDYAHRVLHLMDTQLSKMHTRLRDGTCIPYMSFYLTDVLDQPTPLHIFQEQPLVKWTWDEVYDEAFDEELPRSDNASTPRQYATESSDSNVTGSKTLS